MCFKTTSLFSLINGLENTFFTSPFLSWQHLKKKMQHLDVNTDSMCKNLSMCMCCKFMCLRTSIFIILSLCRSLSGRWPLLIGRHGRLFWFSIHTGFFCHPQKNLEITIKMMLHLKTPFLMCVPGNLVQIMAPNDQGCKISMEIVLTLKS